MEKKEPRDIDGRTDGRTDKRDDISRARRGGIAKE